MRGWDRALLRQPLHSWYIACTQVPGLAERQPAVVAEEILSFLA